MRSPSKMLSSVSCVIHLAPILILSFLSCTAAKKFSAIDFSATASQFIISGSNPTMNIPLPASRSLKS